MKTADGGPGQYPFADIELRWRRVWESTRVFETEFSPGVPTWYVMELPPFANGTLHLGHVRNYAIADASARFHRQLGERVLYTSGFDTFGLPNETAAAEAGCHPKELADRNVAMISEQFRRLALSHDRRRITDYGDPRFYRWVQWVFLRLFEGDLAYRSRREVNWCQHCESSVEDGLVSGDSGCWRCGTSLEIRSLDQWFVRETEFAESVLDGVDRLERWPEAVKDIQRRFVGRVEGLLVSVDVLGLNRAVAVFVEQPELLLAATSLALSPDHPLVASLRDDGVLDAGTMERLGELRRPGGRPQDQQARRAAYANRAAVPLGVSALHPVNGAPLPLVVVAPWTVPGEGAVFGVPERETADATVARDVGLPAGPFEGAAPAEVRDGVVSDLCRRGWAKPVLRYALRDWPFSRQRYWGAPVPIIHCGRCGPVAVPDEDLPVRLPLDVDVTSAVNPLPNLPEFLHVICPACREPAHRDVDTLGAYSSPWWYLWIAKGVDGDDPFSDGNARRWLPVDLMVGGIEQSTTCFFHARTVARALAKVGVVDHLEPITEVLAIGMVKAAGVKMSKSAGNAVPVDELVARFGADALRLAVLGAAAPANDFDWSERLVVRQHHWLTRAWRFVDHRRDDLAAGGDAEFIDEGSKLRRTLARRVGTAVAKATSGFHNNGFHLVVKDVAFLFERLEEFDRTARDPSGRLSPEDCQALAIGVRSLAQALGPLAPNLAEEVWDACGQQPPLAAGGWPTTGRRR